MKLYIRYYRDKQGRPRGTMVAIGELRKIDTGYMWFLRYGWSFCHPKDMRNGLFSKRAGRAYAYERMFSKRTALELDRSGHGVPKIGLPDCMLDDFRKFIADCYSRERKIHADKIEGPHSNTTPV